MVDVGDKAVTRREARAGARVWMAPQTMRLLQQAALPKGDVLAVARIAGMMAAKRTAELIPLCHPLALTHVEVAFAVQPEASRVDIEVTTRTDGKTGVEMEALTGAGVAALTIYDMCKAVDRGMVVGDIRLLEKSGGKEAYVRSEGIAGEATVTSARRGSSGEALPAGVVLSVNVSPGKGERKKSVERVTLRAGHGIEGDGHAGPWHRQVSLLAQESIDTMREKGLDVGPGDFAENITTRGIDVCALPLGTRMRIGPALVELTQIGKVCHDRCAIYYQAGDCVMPREGVFVQVLEGGEAASGDLIVVLELGAPAAATGDPEHATPAGEGAGGAEVGGPSTEADEDD